MIKLAQIKIQHRAREEEIVRSGHSAPSLPLTRSCPQYNFPFLSFIFFMHPSSLAMTVSITPRLRPSANEVQERKMENRVRRKKSARDALAGKGDGGRNELVAREGRIETEIKIVREREREARGDRCTQNWS